MSRSLRIEHADAWHHIMSSARSLWFGVGPRQLFEVIT